MCLSVNNHFVKSMDYVVVGYDNAYLKIDGVLVC